ncbi:MAG: hypothetical protein H0U49_06700 [Parachlamydiaceae bacterium]|nr:hypothetical protein [Parachlamydiaceae bacterium]
MTPDILLIYRYDGEIIYLERIGSVRTFLT